MKQYKVYRFSYHDLIVLALEHINHADEHPSSYKVESYPEGEDFGLAILFDDHEPTV